MMISTDSCDQPSKQTGVRTLELHNDLFNTANAVQEHLRVFVTRSEGQLIYWAQLDRVSTATAPLPATLAW